MRLRRISLKLLHPSLWRSNGNAADAMFTVWVVSSSTSASVVWICAVVWVSPSSACQRRQSQLHISYICRPLPDKKALISLHPLSCFFFFFFAYSSIGAWNGVQSKAVIGGFLPWEKRPVLLGCEMSHWCLPRVPLSTGAPLMETESITGQQPCGSTWGLLSSAH